MKTKRFVRNISLSLESYRMVMKILRNPTLIYTFYKIKKISKKIKFDLFFNISLLFRIFSGCQYPHWSSMSKVVDVVNYIKREFPIQFLEEESNIVV